MDNDEKTSALGSGNNYDLWRIRPPPQSEFIQKNRSWHHCTTLYIKRSYKGRFYSEQPPLNALEGENLAYGLHFKQLYAKVTRECWGFEAIF